MKHINLNFAITDLEGAVVQGAETAAKLLSIHLANAKHADPVKVMGWAFKLRKDKVLVLDDSDYKTLKDFVSSLSIPALAHAPIINAMDNAKEVDEKEGL